MINYRRAAAVGVLLAATTGVLAGCGSGSTAPSSGAAQSAAATGAPNAGTAATPPKKDTGLNPAGDIPDNQVYVPYTSPNHVFSVTVPQGWAQRSQPGAVVFSDHYNSVRIASHPSTNPPTVASVQSTVLPGLQAHTPGYAAGSVSTVNRKAGPAVLATYHATSAPDPVTGKTVTLDVQRYEFAHAGHTVVLTLSAPVGSDNVDPWNTITNSLRWL